MTRIKQVAKQFKELHSELVKKIRIASVQCKPVECTELVKRYCEVKKELNKLKGL